MSINNEKKLNEEWLAFIRGDVVINANKKWRLHAKLVRAAILDIMAEEERHLNISYDRDLSKFKNALIEKGILKNKKESINNRFFKWLGALIFGATIVWATNELIRFDKPIPTETQVEKNNPEYESSNYQYSMRIWWIRKIKFKRLFIFSRTKECECFI